MPGMYVEASVKVTAKADSYLVPTSAIIVSTGGQIRCRGEGREGDSSSDGIANDGLTEVTGEFTDEELVLEQTAFQQYLEEVKRTALMASHPRGTAWIFPNIFRIIPAGKALKHG